MAQKREGLSGHNLTETQVDALRMLAAAGSGAYLAKTGQVLCKGTVGERFEEDRGFASLTWLALVALGLVCGSSGRLYPSNNGWTALRLIDGTAHLAAHHLVRQTSSDRA